MPGPSEDKNVCFVFVPGATAPASHYTNLVTALREHGYDGAVVSTPSVGYKPGPPATMNDDANAIRNITTRIADEGKQIVLVMHSYGGIPGTESVAGVSVKERRAQGKSGGIVKMVYMAAVVPALGESSNSMSGGQTPDHLKIVGEHVVIIDFAACAIRTFTGLPFTRSLEWAQDMLPHSALAFEGRVTNLGYDHVPVTYIHCTKDDLLPPEFQLQFVKKITERTGVEPLVEEIATGHCPNASEPDKVIQILLRAIQDL